MIKVIKSGLVIAAIVAIAGTATWSYFSDTETSEGNTFSAGSIDLNIDGQNSNVVKFTRSNLRPGNQPKDGYLLANVGTIDGFLDLENISVTSFENECVDPEIDAGDATCDDPGEGDGELQDVLNLRLFVDYGCDGWISTGDNVFYNDVVANLPSNFDLDEDLDAGDDVCIEALFDWWNTPNDDLAQTDSFELDLTFELTQNAD